MAPARRCATTAQPPALTRPHNHRTTYSLRSLGSINLVSKMPQSKDGKSALMPPVVPLSAGAAVEDGF